MCRDGLNPQLSWEKFSGAGTGTRPLLDCDASSMCFLGGNEMFSERGAAGSYPHASAKRDRVVNVGSMFLLM